MTATLSLDDARTRAATAAEAATEARDRLARGDDIPAAELAALEQTEQHSRRVLDAAQERDRQRREQDDADALARDRAAIQAEWAQTADGEPAELVQLREDAARAAAPYLAAYRERLDYLDDLRDRAAAVGFAVDATTARPSCSRQGGW